MDNFKALLRRVFDRELALISMIAALIICLIFQIRRADMAEVALAEEKESHLASLKEDHKRKWEVVDFYGERMLEERKKTSLANRKAEELVGRLEKAVAAEMNIKDLFRFVTTEE